MVSLGPTWPLGHDLRDRDPFTGTDQYQWERNIKIIQLFWRFCSNNFPLNPSYFQSTAWFCNRFPVFLPHVKATDGRWIGEICVWWFPKLFKYLKSDFLVTLFSNMWKTCIYMYRCVRSDGFDVRLVRSRNKDVQGCFSLPNGTILGPAEVLSRRGGVKIGCQEWTECINNPRDNDVTWLATSNDFPSIDHPPGTMVSWGNHRMGLFNKQNEGWDYTRWIWGSEQPEIMYIHIYIYLYIFIYTYITYIYIYIYIYIHIYT